MNGERIDARRVGLGLRPPRVAVLVGRGCGWGDCIDLIGTLTQIWGGATWSIIPTDGKSIARPFWRLLKRHDPDWVVRFEHSVEVTDDLWGELSRNLCLALPWGRNLGIIWPDNIGWPYTEIHECLPDSEPVNKVRDVKISGSLLAQALIYASTGYFHEGAKESLEEKGLEVDAQEIALSSQAGGIFDLANDIWGKRYRQPGSDLPLWLSHRYIGAFTSAMPRQHAIVAVCGDRLEDFALFWTLRTLRGAFLSNVFWIPRLYDPDAKEDDIARLWPHLAYALPTQLREVYGDKRILATSLSLPLKSLGSLGEMLVKAAIVSTRDEKAEVTAVHPDEIAQLLPYETNYWELNNSPAENSAIVQFVGGRGTAILNTPIPKKVTVGFESKMRWMVDAEIEGVRLPVRPSLTGLLVETERMASFRVSKTGVSYEALSAMTMGYMTVESMLVRPRLRLPADDEVINTLGREAELMLVPSPAGQFEAELIRLMGGVEAVGGQLGDRTIVQVLTKFCDDSPNAKGIFDEGVNIDGRRYLDLRAMAKICGDDEEAKLLAESFLMKRVLQRGYLIKCPHCRKADWYRLAELSDTVTCHRCSREHVFAADAVQYFRLDEMAMQALRGGSVVSLLTLDYLRRQSERGFTYVTAREVRRQGADREKPWLEVDFVAVVDGVFSVGEAKRGGKLSGPNKAQLKRYVELCGRLQPDKLVVVTGDAHWGEGSTTFLDDLELRLSNLDIGLTRLVRGDIGWMEKAVNVSPEVMIAPRTERDEPERESLLGEG